jgi:hypothetical protein
MSLWRRKPPRRRPLTLCEKLREDFAQIEEQLRLARWYSPGDVLDLEVGRRNKIRELQEAGCL